MSLQLLSGLAAAALAAMLAQSPAECESPRLVGVVDHRLVCQGDLLKSWQTDWRSEKIAESFKARGMDAEVIGADVLRSAEKLKSYRAIMIPGDQCYPEEGNLNGLISKNIAEFVRSGGVYIMPVGMAHLKWRDVETGAIGKGAGDGERDFLGLQWRTSGDRSGGMKVTPSGEKAGLQAPTFASPVDCFAYSVDQATTPVCSYVDSSSGRPCLYAIDMGKGAVVHFSGSNPLDSSVRDWLVGCYAAILKGGPDLTLIRSQRALKSRVYTTLPVCDRSKASELTLSDGWQLCQAKDEFSVEPTLPRDDSWTAVRMPNTIQYALYLAGKIDNPWWSDSYKHLRWIQDADWYLRCRFRVPRDWQGKRIRLRFDGVDYLAAVWLDGRFLGNHEGMFGGPTFDLSDALKPSQEHELLIRLLHDTGPALKPLAIVGWNNWGNQYRTIGLWQPVRLVVTESAYMEAPYVKTTSISKSSADLWAQAQITNTGDAFRGTVSATITDPGTGEVVWREDANQQVAHGTSYWERGIKLPNPKLWWPNGMGDHPLYRLDLKLLDGGKASDSISARFGVRTLELRRNPASPDSPRDTSCAWWTDAETEPLVHDAMRDSDESHRFLFVVNGRPFYANGTNWHTADGLFAQKETRQKWYVKTAVAMGINLFRLNGGNALFEDERFCDLCDENGILVWQDIHVCGARGTDIPLSTWREQLTQTVLRLRTHPCLALYCGGNEYVPYRNEMMAVLGIARDVFASYDDRPFRMSSTAGGCWHYPFFDKGGYNFIAEWHVAYGYSNMSQFKRTIPNEELSGGPVGYDMKKIAESHPILHERFCESSWLVPVYCGQTSWYLDLDKAGIGDYIQAQQIFRAESNEYAAEQWRSQYPVMGGHAFWGFNPQSPTSAWHVIDWFGQPEPIYYALKRTAKPVLVMAKMNSNRSISTQIFIADWFSLAPGETFKASVLGCNSTTKPVRDARITARLLDPEMHPIVEKAWSSTIPANGGVTDGHEMEWKIPGDARKGWYFLDLTATDSAGRAFSRRMYPFRIHDGGGTAITKDGPRLRPQIEALPTSLRAKVVSATQASPSEAEVTVEIVNTGKNPAYPVQATLLPDTQSTLWSDNFLWLRPGQRVKLKGTVRLDMSGLDLMSTPTRAKLTDLSVTVTAWNAGECRLAIR